MKRIIVLISFLFILTSCGKEKQYELVCDEGTLENDKCMIVQTKEVSKQCREGYTLNEENNKCENTITLDAKKVSECPNGYFIGSDNWCLSEKEYEKELKINCESKNIKDDDQFSTTYVTDAGVCVEKLCVKVAEDGSSCLEFKESILEAKKEESCPDGTKNDRGVCRKKYWMGKDYSCELGELVDKKCVISDIIEMDSYCEDSKYKLNEEKQVCEKIIYKDAKLKEIK